MYAVPDGFHSFFTVLDGHNGPQTSNWLLDNLVNALLGSLGDLYSRVKGASPDQEPLVEDIEKTFKDTFKRVDDQIVLEAAEKALAAPTRDEGAALLAQAYSGSSATVAFYNSHTRLLHVSAVGDSRAVLGRRVALPGGRHVYAVRELTVAQAGRVSRAFGDGRHKWPRGLHRRLAEAGLARAPPDAPRMPPHLTAAPEVTATAVAPGDFLVVASAGLWERLAGADAVGLVGWWLDARAAEPAGPVRGRLREPLLPRELPVAGGFDAGAVRVRAPHKEPRFVNQDENAATHLVRNALGGADEEQLAEVLNIEPGQEARRVRYVSERVLRALNFSKLHV